jgi:hypothetical protein
VRTLSGMPNSHLQVRLYVRYLNEVKDNIEDAYAKRKIGEQHYNLLSKKIESFVNTNNNKSSDDKLEHANKTYEEKSTITLNNNHLHWTD